MSEHFRIRLCLLFAAISLSCCLLPLTEQPAPESVLIIASGRTLPAVQPVALPEWMSSFNEADADELQLLPGVGETIASMILTEKEQNGPFYYAEDLMHVKGIGPKSLQKVLPVLETAFIENGGD